MKDQSSESWATTGCEGRDGGDSGRSGAVPALRSPLGAHRNPTPHPVRVQAHRDGRCRRPVHAHPGSAGGLHLRVHVALPGHRQPVRRTADRRCERGGAAQRDRRFPLPGHRRGPVHRRQAPGAPADAGMVVRERHPHHRPGPRHRPRPAVGLRTVQRRRQRCRPRRGHQRPRLRDPDLAGPHPGPGHRERAAAGPGRDAQATTGPAARLRRRHRDLRDDPAPQPPGRGRRLPQGPPRTGRPADLGRPRPRQHAERRAALGGVRGHARRPGHVRQGRQRHSGRCVQRPPATSRTGC